MNKLALIASLLVAAALGAAQDTCCAAGKAVEKKAQTAKAAKPQGDCCAATEKAVEKKAQTAKAAKPAAQGECCAAGEKAVDMKAQTAKTQEECCKSTEAKPLAKGDPGCCNAKGETAKFKVYVVGGGYKLFGCEGSAKKGREDIVAGGKLAGPIQKVVSKKSVIS